MSKARLSVAAALAAIAAVNAAEITVEQAGIAVQRWLDENPALVSMNGASVASAETINTTTGSRLHVVKLADGGFAVTSADDRVDPVLVFVRDGDELIQDEANPLWALLSGDIAARERAAGVSAPAKGGSLLRAASVPDCAARAQARWAALLAGSTSGGKPLPVLKASAGLSSLPDTRVASFVDSRWNQSTHNNYTNGKKCYNYYTPSNYVCGCVATVGGQIMRYWQWPQTSVTPKTKTCSVNGTNASYTMKGGTYDWSSMPLVPASGVTDAQCQAIGKLTYDVGVSVCMDWASDGSGANMFALTKRLTDTFWFENAEAAIYTTKYSYSLDNVKKAVIPNCNARAPLAMSVTGMSDGHAVGHAVLVDGYGYSGSDFYIHVNLGWGGYNDAWYMPPDIEDFSAIDGFILNIFPEKTGSIISGRVLDASGAPIANASVTLKRNSTAVDSTTTDANGIYAFIASAPNSYLITATSGSVSATISVSLAKTTGTSLADDGGWYNTAASIGNTFDSDIALTGVASVALPVFSPDSCLFYPSTNVVITCADAGAVIRYTTDGSDPDASSAVYTGPIFVDDDVTIKARAFEDGKNPSPVVGAVYNYDSAQGAPKGDYFADPIKISGASGSRVIEDNSKYTVEDEEPLHTLENYSYYNQYHTIWYEWTAPGSGTMTCETKCSKLSGNTIYRKQTAVAVYTGLDLSSLTRLAYATQPDSANEYATTLNVAVEQGVTYYIVGMTLNSSATGSFTLSWSGDLTVSQTETSTTEVPVSYTWLDEYFPGRASAIEDYETLANGDSDGDGLATWAEFLLGTDPTNALSRLEATIRMDGMTPIVESNADTNRLATFGYQPAVKGKQTLDATAEWAATNSSHRFFKVFVEMRGP